MYAGFVGSYKQQIENKTFIKTADGKIKVTGEGFLPIIKFTALFWKHTRKIISSFQQLFY